jgi:DNA-binding transcriptional regulator YiaG
MVNSSRQLQEWMQAAGLNQQQAAEVFGVKKRCLQYWLQGRQLPGPAEQLLSVLEQHPSVQSFLLSSHTQ